MPVPAAYIVKVLDSHGLPVNVYGVCAHCADADAPVKEALRTSAVLPTIVQGHEISRAPADTRWTCDYCETECPF